MTNMFDGDIVVIADTDIVVVFMFENVLSVMQTVVMIIFVSE